LRFGVGLPFLAAAFFLASDFDSDLLMRLR
jgi:hypothetical protein